MRKKVGETLKIDNYRLHLGFFTEKKIQLQLTQT